MGRGPLVGLLACGTLVSCRQNFPGVDGPRQEHVAACTTMPQIVSWKKKQKKSSLLFHRHRHFGMDLSCCCWRVLLQKNFVCFKPRLHPRLAAGATLMLVLINCGVGLHQLHLYTLGTWDSVAYALLIPICLSQLGSAICQFARNVAMYSYLHSFPRATSWMHCKMAPWNCKVQVPIYCFVFIHSEV